MSGCGYRFALMRPGRVYCEKFPRSGAGILSSLTETSGLLELAEDLDRVEAGAFYPFLSFPSLIY